MNDSIYLMIGVPYVTLMIVGFLIYRGCKKNAAYRHALGDGKEQPPPVVVQSTQGAT
jgi:hypothetical protein